MKLLQEDILFYMLYAAVAMLSMTASFYLLFRRGNAFAAGVTSSLRLRRWTAFFFAAIGMSHVWYFLAYLQSSSDAVVVGNLIGGLLDSMTLIPLAFVILLVMLQDRRRPLWPVILLTAPLIVGMAWGVVSRSYAFMPMVRLYFLLASIGFFIYMVFSTRQYEHWLRDNYADLERKEVWQSLVVLAVMFFMLGFYVFGIEGSYYEHVTQVGDGILVCFLLWRVETLSDLRVRQPQIIPVEDSSPSPDISGGPALLPPEGCKRPGVERPLVLPENIEPLLKQYCEEPQLYLQHDISLAQLSTAIGINRSYLSQYFTSQGINYNAYINGLRIRQFVILYQEAVAARQPVTAQQLAYKSGFRSYSTFSAAFKQSMGMTATQWMRNEWA